MATPLSERRMADLEAYSDQNERASMNTVGVDISDLRSLIAEVRASRAERARLIETWERYGRRDLDREEFEGTIAEMAYQEKLANDR